MQLLCCLSASCRYISPYDLHTSNMTLFDELAEKLGDDQWNEWKAKVLDAKEEIAAFVASRRPGRGAEVLDWFQGSFNFCLQVTYNDGTPDVMVRFPSPGHTTSQDEKIRNEVQVIQFLHESTSIPVPHLFSWGLTEDSPQHLGPFIISEFVEGVHVSDILVDPETLRIKAVLDLESTNAMPRQFASDAPWWLLLVGPDSYLLRDHTLGEFVEAYEPRLEHFLQVMERVEGARDGGAGGAQPLSRLMRESWDTKRFWFNYAARKPFDVEVFFDGFLNESNVGIGSLDEDAREGLESFVEMKMKQLRAYDDECSRAL
jgi:hypothetical protein